MDRIEHRKIAAQHPARVKTLATQSMTSAKAIKVLFWIWNPPLPT